MVLTLNRRTLQMAARRSVPHRALFLVLLGVAIGLPAAHGLSLRPLGATSGLAAKVVPWLAVDRNGFLWVGSREGLFRYDGYRAVRYHPDSEDPRSITDIDLRSIYEDPAGVIWIGTNTGGLNRFDAASGSFDHYRHDSADPSSLSNDSVYGMAEGPQGDLWVGTQIGLNRLDRRTGRFTRYLHRSDDPTSLSSDYVFTLHLDRAGVLWVATVGGGLNRWQPEAASFARYDLAASTGGPAELNDVFGLLEDATGTLWAGTRAGLVRIDQQRQRFSRQALAAAGERHPLITAIELAPNGDLWLATLSHGLLRLNPASGEATRVASETLPQGLPLMSLTASGGALFVGTWGGGVYFGREPESRFTLLGGGGEGATLRNENITAVIGTETPGRPWVGSFGGGPQRADVEAGAAELLPGETSDLWLEGVLALARTPDGRLFAGTTDGLWELREDGSPIRFFEHAADLPGSLGAGYVTSLLVTPGDGLWVGVGGSGLYHLAEGASELTAYRHDPESTTSLTGDYVTTLLAEPGGFLWVGTRSSGLNLCRVREWSCRRFPADPGSADGLHHHHVTSLYRDRRQRLWVGTDGGGLHQAVRDARGNVGFRHWGSREGLISDSLMAIVEDDDGSLWLSAREGLTRLDPDSGRASNYVAETGLPVSHFNNEAAAADDRYLYFGAVSGLLSIPRGQPVPIQRPAPVRITAIDSPDFRQAPPAPAWELGAHRLAYGDTLSVEFAVLDFAESLHEYEYRLAPDEPWSRLGPRREVTFFGLAPGRHKFEVRGRDVQGLWSQAPPLRLEIVPPFWMTAWFRATGALVVGLVAFGGPALRLRVLGRRNRELIRLKAQRERALALAQEREAELTVAYEGLSRLTRRLEKAKEEERQHISRELHDELGQSLTAAKIQLQLLQKEMAGAGESPRLGSAVTILEDMIGQVRDISFSLRPPLLDEAGLVPALEHYLATLAERTGVAIAVEVEPGFPECPPEVATTLFRVIQEAVSNSLRHSGARHIRVGLSAVPGAVRAVAEDDGCGFDADEVRRRARRGEHLGLLGIRERLRSVGGTIELESTPAAGTRLEARVPR